MDNHHSFKMANCHVFMPSLNDLSHYHLRLDCKGPDSAVTGIGACYIGFQWNVWFKVFDCMTVNFMLFVSEAPEYVAGLRSSLWKIPICDSIVWLSEGSNLGLSTQKVSQWSLIQPSCKVQLVIDTASLYLMNNVINAVRLVFYHQSVRWTQAMVF